jgi:hypothetical protein
MKPSASQALDSVIPITGKSANHPVATFFQSVMSRRITLFVVTVSNLLAHTLFLICGTPLLVV